MGRTAYDYDAIYGMVVSCRLRLASLYTHVQTYLHLVHGRAHTRTRVRTWWIARAAWRVRRAIGVPAKPGLVGDWACLW